MTDTTSPPGPHTHGSLPSGHRPMTVHWTVVHVIGGGFVCFILPPLLMGLLAGESPPAWSLVVVALTQLGGAIACIRWWLRRFGVGWSSLGISATHWRRDVLIGAATVPPRLALEILVLVPLAGGAANHGVRRILDTTAEGPVLFAAALFLGVVGGGIAEELFFRGHLIGAVPAAFGATRRALAVAAIASVVLFAAGHIPSNGPDAIAILLAGSIYTALFLVTGRLTACVAAHCLWNVAAVLTVIAIYG